ncbi:MAG TPA: LysR family transcriptional regulator [Kofleriaceae bacterium]|nr:LysR family transcriptional regulator [Kofleriaceae bacterium]
MNLASIDLNLLLVLAVTLEERSATRAARRLHVTQSAVSNALARLRELLGDPLLVRSGRGLAPTARARELAPTLTAAIAGLQEVVDGGAAFDPAACTREVSLACADGQQLCDLPPIAAAFARTMPRAHLRVVSIDTLIATDGLATGEVDLAIAPHAAYPGLPSTPLYRDDGVGVLRRDHPYRGRRLTPRAFATIPQVALQVALGRTGLAGAAAEKSFRANGLSRAVALSVPSFAAAARVVAATDQLVCLPRRVATALAADLPLRIVELPMPSLTVELSLVWHARTQRDPAVAWVRDLVTRALVAGGRGRERSRPR